MKTVRIAELKARLSEYLRGVRRGDSLVVLDRETPIARVVPYSTEGEALTVREPLGKYSSVHAVPLPAPVELPVDVVAVLLEERQSER